MLACDILHADETTVQVLREPGRAVETKSFMWLYRTGREGPPIAIFEYQQTRSGKHPEVFLKGFSGYLQVDGYSGYEGIPEVTLVACWAHARRKFDEALKALAASVRNKESVVAAEGLSFCNALFAIERDLSNVSSAVRHAARLERSQPVLDAFRTWLEEKSIMTLPKNALGRAVTCAMVG